jgi:ribonuclease R
LNRKRSAAAPNPGKGSRGVSGAMPSKEEILAFIADEGGDAKTPRLGKREIARAFAIKGEHKIQLKQLLKELERDGAIARDRKSLVKAGHLPAVVAVEIVSRNKDGELIARPVEWQEEIEGAVPKILLVVPRRPKAGIPVPGIGDRGLARIESGSGAGHGATHLGRIIKLLPRAKAQILGVFRQIAGAAGRILPVDKKNIGRELLVPVGAEGDAVDGDLVAVEVLHLGRAAPPAARVRERLGSLASERAISLIAIHTHNIPDRFSAQALTEAEKLGATTLGGRQDWRKLPLITIDPADAKDHDDAVHAETDSDPANPGGHIVTVAIADVAAYVRAGSALDREALERGNSVYFPDRVVPMLPERISNDLCSLRPNEDRPALAVRMVLFADGRKKTHSFHRILMRSAAKLSYAEAQAAVDGQATTAGSSAITEHILRPLWAAYAALAAARKQRSPLDLDLPERKLILKTDGTVDRVLTPARLEAHRLIEECMILANVAAAETLEQHKQPFIYRAHDEPTLEKLQTLNEFLASIGQKLPKGSTLRPRDFNAVLARAKGTDNENLVHEIVLRSQAQAEYTARNYGHFGLNLRRYAHFTSPIRRYADLTVHRALIKAEGLGKDGATADGPELDEIAARVSAAERRAMAAERETNDRLIAAFLSEKVGATFNGRIAGISRAGLFVRLDETGADGFIAAATLGDDYFRHDEKAHAMVGARTGEMHRLGDPVTVKLIEVAPFAGGLRFELLSEGRIGARPRLKHKASVRPSKLPHKALRQRSARKSARVKR